MRDALVICYHGVSEDWQSDIAIRPSSLEAQVAGFLDLGYRPVTFTEAVTGSTQEPVIAITFDDAYCSVSEHGLPCLAGLGVQGTVFVPTSLVGECRGWDGIESWTSTPWADEIRVMDWDALGRLAAAGWEIGSHTRTHPHLTHLEDEELREELWVSRETIEGSLGVPCTSIAYPYGETDSRVARVAGEAGYIAGAGLLPDRLHVREPLLFPRVYAGRDLRDADLFRRSKPRMRRLQGSSAWPLVAKVAPLRRLLNRKAEQSPAA